MAAADVRRVAGREVEMYTGIQRELSRTRTLEIAEFIRAVDSAFPNSIILNVRSSNVISSGDDYVLDSSLRSDRNTIVNFHISGGEDTFQIIDGQHRLSGFDELNCIDFDLVITLFVDLVVDQQAYLLSTINIKQTKVNKSLVYDLFDISEFRSPQRTAHSVVKILNSDEKSPFYKRIKLLGVTPKFEGDSLYSPLLTQGTVVDRLLGLISDNPDRDRNTERRRERVTLTGDEVERGFIFRPAYVEDQEWVIYKVKVNYFGAVAYSFSVEWNNGNTPLARTIGFGALLRLLVPLYQRGFRDRDVSADYFNSVFARMRSYHDRLETAFSFENFPAAGNGESKLFRYLSRISEIDQDHPNLQV